MIAMEIERFLQCTRHDRIDVDGSLIPGHNFTPYRAYIDGRTLHMDIICKWCTFICTGEQPYRGETPEEIYHEYGFHVDDPYESV